MNKNSFGSCCSVVRGAEAERGARAAATGSRRANKRRRHGGQLCACGGNHGGVPRHTCLASACISLAFQLSRISLNETAPDYRLTES